MNQGRPHQHHMPMINVGNTIKVQYIRILSDTFVWCSVPQSFSRGTSALHVLHVSPAPKHLIQMISLSLSPAEASLSP